MARRGDRQDAGETEAAMTGEEAYNKGDYAPTLEEWRVLATQGNASAQANLGWMYALGRGVPLDYVQAHLWASLAVAQGNKDALMLRNKMVREMTAAQLVEAHRLAREWKPKGK